jgi:hypothetical protein
MIPRVCGDSMSYPHPRLYTVPYKYKETAEILSINSLYPPVLGDIIKLWDTPRSPAGSILNLFSSSFSYNHGRKPRVVTIEFGIRKLDGRDSVAF